MEIFEGIEALIDVPNAAAVEHARELLARLRERSGAATDTIDQFLLDLMTLNFVVESCHPQFHAPVRKMARI
ncbi:hypothetical protein FJ936_29170 [Mesorhizobium sp. B2-4-13]|uniref:hypothetical protein n=1 Tax=Mesorhizobium sp. B2-4-13 TaxID=2589936 RepID=UPI0011519595|nr:hypothetical protein [Mesorhizobium sp. B2-4-13]TPK79957.1 hypothetical protein FJ936_29170 [Mesorhizobium sp. B2-4-13]